MVLSCLFLPQKAHFVSRHPHLKKKRLILFQNVGFEVTYDSIVTATGNFSVNKLIGSGGFGSTYKAELTPDLQLAVKRLFTQKFQGVRQFETEICALERVQHPHLVTLLGFHASESDMFLVYNYLPGGNLENLLYNGKGDLISWKVRLNISLNVAEALLYLHDECLPRVLHRDIKPSNILLDNNFNAYLSDFGLARISSLSETTADVAGTFGYVAPEYAGACHLSRKADVYSFGVVLLELLSGRRVLDPSFVNCDPGLSTVVFWAHRMYDKGLIADIFAPGLSETCPRRTLIRALELALSCTAYSAMARPSMKEVVDYLKSLQGGCIHRASVCCGYCFRGGMVAKKIEPLQQG